MSQKGPEHYIKLLWGRAAMVGPSTEALFSNLQYTANKDDCYVFMKETMMD